MGDCGRLSAHCGWLTPQVDLVAVTKLARSALIPGKSCLVLPRPGLDRPELQCKQRPWAMLVGRARHARHLDTSRSMDNPLDLSCHNMQCGKPIGRSFPLSGPPCRPALRYVPFLTARSPSHASEDRRKPHLASWPSSCLARAFFVYCNHFPTAVNCLPCCVVRTVEIEGECACTGLDFSSLANPKTRRHRTGTPGCDWTPSAISRRVVDHSRQRARNLF